MLWRTHAGTGVLFGLAVDTAAALAGHPLPAEQALALPAVSGYLSAVPDVDHHSARIRHAVPPVRWLYVLVQTVLGMTAGMPRPGLAWYGLLPRPCLRWPAASERRMRYWMGHRRITHSLPFAAVLGVLAEIPVLWLGGWWWLGPAVALGCVAHLAGDCLTVQGCPLWLPWSGRHYRLLRWRTSGVGEGVFAGVQGAVSVGLGWVLLGGVGA